MVSNLLGTFFSDQIDQILSGAVSMAETNQLYVLALFIFSPLFIIGWPAWLIGTARLFLKEKITLEI